MDWAGGLVWLGHRVHIAVVVGSNPTRPTKNFILESFDIKQLFRIMQITKHMYTHFLLITETRASTYNKVEWVTTLCEEGFSHRFTSTNRTFSKVVMGNFKRKPTLL